MKKRREANRSHTKHFEPLSKIARISPIASIVIDIDHIKVRRRISSSRGQHVRGEGLLFLLFLVIANKLLQRGPNLREEKDPLTASNGQKRRIFTERNRSNVALSPMFRKTVSKCRNVIENKSKDTCHTR